MKLILETECCWRHLETPSDWRQARLLFAGEEMPYPAIFNNIPFEEFLKDLENVELAQLVDGPDRSWRCRWYLYHF